MSMRTPRNYPRTVFTRDEQLAFLRGVIERRGTRLTARIIREEHLLTPGPRLITTYVRSFWQPFRRCSPGWREYGEIADNGVPGLKPDVEAFLRRFRDCKGRPATRQEYDLHRPPGLPCSVSLYTSAYDSWVGALAAAGVLAVAQ